MIIKPIASGSKGNCYYITGSKSSILLDAGIPIKNIQIATDFKLNEIAAAFITHRHNDHAAAVPKLAQMGVRIFAPLDVFTSKNAMTYNSVPVNDGDEFYIGGWTVKAFRCKHDVPCVGYLFIDKATGEKLLYFTDTYYVEYTFPPCDYILAECNNSVSKIRSNVEQGRVNPALGRRLIRSHMSIDTLEQMLRENDLSRLKTIYLTHLSDTNSDEEEFKRRIQRLTGCEVVAC